jgi:hypothetical protein
MTNEDKFRLSKGIFKNNLIETPFAYYMPDTYERFASKPWRLILIEFERDVGKEFLVSLVVAILAFMLGRYL